MGPSSEYKPKQYEIIVIDGPHRGYVWKTGELKPYFVMANNYPDDGYSVHQVIDCDGVYVAKIQQSGYGKV